jgi:hypothetical protein
VLDAAFGSIDEKGQVTAPYFCALNPEGIAGWDRPEVFADPFHGNRVYLSMACAVMQQKEMMKQKDGEQPKGGEKPTLEVIWRSDDLAHTWRLGASLPHSMFYSMATTPRGGDRLWLMGEGFLARSDDAGDHVFGPWNLQAETGLLLDPSNWTDIPGTRVLAQSPQALARLGDGKLVAAYRTKPVADGVREYALVLITGADGNSPHARPLDGGSINAGVIRAQAAGGSVFELTLVSDTRPTGAGAVVAYWLESTPPKWINGNLEEMRLRARYAVISPLTDQIVLEGDLAEPAGWKHQPPTDAQIKARDNGFWYGDYFHGASFPADRPDAMNFALVWPQDDGLFMRTLTVLDPELSPARFNGVWEKTFADRPAVWGWGRADFDKRNADLNAQGYRLRDINAFVLPGDQGERFNAVWDKTTDDRPAVWGWGRADFDKRNADLKAQGYRLRVINAFVLPGSQGEHFNAVWDKTTDDRPAVYGWARSDFDKRSKDLKAQGYRLRDINAYVLPGDQGERFNAVWEKTTVDRPAVWGWARADFDRRVDELNAQGYRLRVVNAFVLRGGQGERFNAVWEKTTADRPAVYDWGRGDFDKRQADRQAQGYRLAQINAFVLP